ncbi:PREDICTED: uncharacterized protein LOC104757524 [Camelina sativa]|uniref:Uncharacterized protein LOC104757524 n=1 Tax=Camelina sativa TaxID=90675 RepID=A0ABM1R6N4_CAMSA|nr:PREDICTED: uncharacterized protein LOC104757524 [Camelina sativa]
MTFSSRTKNIPDIINGAFVDLQYWKDCLLYNQAEPNNGTSQGEAKQYLAKKENTGDINMKTNDYCCFVDGSWVSPSENAGIGWVLCNSYDQIIFQGKASVKPMNTPLEVEAEALRTNRRIKRSTLSLLLIWRI